IASFISKIVGMLYRVPLKAIIGKVGNDYYGTAFEIYSIVLIISCYSIPLAVSKQVAVRMAGKRYKDAWTVLKGSLVFAVVSGGAASLVLFFGAQTFSELLRTPLAAVALRVLSPVPLIVGVIGVFRGFFQGLHRMMPSAISQIIEQIVNAIVSIIAAYYLFTYGSKVGAILGNPENIASAYGAAGGTLGTASGALAALIFIGLVFLLFRSNFVRRVRHDYTKNSETESLGYSMKTLLITIIPVLLSTTLYNLTAIVDQYIFKNMAFDQLYTPKQVSEWWGVYIGQYMLLINVPISIASAMASSSVPSLTEAFYSKNPGLVKRRIHSATRFIMAIAIPSAVGMTVLGGPIMEMLFFDPDPISRNMMLIGSVAIIFYALSTLSNGLLQGIDKLRIPVMNAAVSLVVQALLLVLLMRVFHLNIYAVIIANAFYAFLMCILNGIAIRRYSGYRQDILTTYLIPLGASLVMGVIVFGVYKLIMLFGDLNIIATLISVVVGIVVYFVALLLMKGLSKQDLYRLPKGDYLVAFAERLHLI
ncbi:MAG: polysaccharide biosynthesis protein, partial [Lachnospiraceae bacterium]|nr:polysaccharide biosynthesis protein [Lachnospiraceae bacterium]